MKKIRKLCFTVLATLMVVSNFAFINPVRSQVPISYVNYGPRTRAIELAVNAFTQQFYEGNRAHQDKFPLFTRDLTKPILDAQPTYKESSPNIAGLYNKTWLKYTVAGIKAPLFAQDYYWGKYENARAGVREVNRISVLKPGDRIGLISSGYLTLSSYSGYIYPARGYYYGSGLCWTVSVFGAVVDRANRRFEKKFGLPLFIKESAYPHGTWYQTYAGSNNGYGYTVLKDSSGRNQVDYVFRVNPQIANKPKTKNLKIQFTLYAKTTAKRAYRGQQVAGFLRSNIWF